MPNFFFADPSQRFEKKPDDQRPELYRIAVAVGPGSIVQDIIFRACSIAVDWPPGPLCFTMKNCFFEDCLFVRNGVKMPNFAEAFPELVEVVDKRKAN